MSIGNAMENAILNKVFSNLDFSVTGVYVSLHASDPGETGAGEISATGAYNRAGSTFTTGTSGAIENVGTIEFTTMMPSGTITHVGLWDAQAAGIFLWGGALGAPKNVNEGDTFTIVAGTLDISLD